MLYESKQQNEDSKLSLAPKQLKDGKVILDNGGIIGLEGRITVMKGGVTELKGDILLG